MSPRAPKDPPSSGAGRKKQPMDTPPPSDEQTYFGPDHIDPFVDILGGCAPPEIVEAIQELEAAMEKDSGDEGSAVDSDGDDPSASEQEGPEPLVEKRSAKRPAKKSGSVELTTATILDEKFDWTDLDVCEKELKSFGFGFNHRWEVFRLPQSDENIIAKIRCIHGSSLQVKCRCHTSDAPVDPKTSKKRDCKLHIDITGRFEGAQILWYRWAVYGTSIATHAEHTEAAARCSQCWAT